MNDGGSAFPTDNYSGHSITFDEAKAIYKHEGNCPGMSLRDYFAGQSLCGLLVLVRDVPTTRPTELANTSYAIADAMLAERAKGAKE